MSVLFLLLYLLAAVFFALATFNVVPSRINFVALGLLCWVLVPLIHSL